jgi:hypothetical protein
LTYSPDVGFVDESSFELLRVDTCRTVSNTILHVYSCMLKRFCIQDIESLLSRHLCRRPNPRASDSRDVPYTCGLSRYCGRHWSKFPAFLDRRLPVGMVLYPRHEVS